jgi:hypothetical protein
MRCAGDDGNEAEHLRDVPDSRRMRVTSANLTQMRSAQQGMLLLDPSVYEGQFIFALAYAIRGKPCPKLKMKRDSI